MKNKNKNKKIMRQTKYKSFYISGFHRNVGTGCIAVCSPGQLRFAVSSWVFNNDNGSASNCAQNCGNNCANNARINPEFRGALFSGLGSCDRESGVDARLKFCQPAGQSACARFSDIKYLFLCLLSKAGRCDLFEHRNMFLKIQKAGDAGASSGCILQRRTSVASDFLFGWGK